MKHSPSRPLTFRHKTFTRRVAATVLAASLVASASEWRALAQETLNCAVNGFCLSNNLTNLLGLPNGTLNITGYQPWDYVVHGPKAGAVLEEPWRGAAAAWGPLEAEARATLSALHGVANDFRLPNAAASDLRAQMLMRLIAIAKKKSDRLALTSMEQDALDAFEDLIVARRVHIAQKALDEYARWEGDPCHYTVPEGFGFEQYDPGPGCSLPRTSLSGPPRPPTADQFKAYGAAVALEPFISADRDAAWREFDQSLALAVGVLGAALVSGAAGILAVSIPAVATTFALIAGSQATFAFTELAADAAAIVSAGIVGPAVAASIPAIVIIAVAVAAVYIVQFTEDQSILPELQQTLDEARVEPSIWSMAQDPITSGELLSTFLIPTSPEYTDEERAAAAAAKIGPSQRGPGDPRFNAGGVLQDTIFTWNGESLLQETFMSQGWFVTRTRSSDGVWGPWQWRLTLDYFPGTLSTPGTRIAGIQPAGFFDAPNSTTARAAPAVKTTSLFILNELHQSQTVTRAGNHAPTLAPTVSDQLTVSTPVRFKANASDADPGNSIVAIRWFIQDPTYDPPRKSADECAIDPPGKIDPLGGFQYQCPWLAIDDNADGGIPHTFGRPGTWGVRVIAKDSEGATATQQFTVNIGNLAPELVITEIPFFALPPDVPSVSEGQQAFIAGTVDYPGLGDGRWGALTILVVDWGDGDVTQRAYPCSVTGLVQPVNPVLPIESDRHCIFDVGSGAAAFTYGPLQNEPPLPGGPWAFSLSHVYTYSSNRPIPTPAAQVKVYAVTTLNAKTDTRRYPVSVINVPPVFEPAPICPFFPADSPIQCLSGDQRTVPVDGSVDLRGRIYDVAGATHFVKVLWGDGTSSAHPAGCTSAGCPGVAQPWFQAAPPPAGSLPAQFVGFTHVYETVGPHEVKLVVDDGAPNGEATYTTQMQVFGVTKPDGPIDVRSGEAMSYTYASQSPPGFTADVTPICEGGTASNATQSGFTCIFDDVSTATARSVKVRALIAATPFERTLDVTVRPPALTISAITGPTLATAGTQETYTYTASHVPGIVFFGASCGLHATMTQSVSGSSFTCRFGDVSQGETTAVSITITAAGVSATSSLDVLVSPDLMPPVLSLPQDIVANSTSNAGALVSYTVSAADVVSGPAAVSCSRASGTLFPIGSTQVSCSANDWKGNHAVGTFNVIVTDATPPTLSLPAPLTVDATSPAGASATFNATADDAAPATPVVACLPASGSTFRIGTTTVACQATDAAGNRATGQFTVTVRTGADQVASLRSYVAGLEIKLGIKKALLATLEVAAKSVAANRPSACPRLAAVGVIAAAAAKRPATGLTADQAAQIVLDIKRIRRVIGC